MNLLVTGGAGYIGSHTVVECLADNHDVVVVDNLANASTEVFERIRRISGKSVEFFEADIRDQSALARIFESSQIDAVIHFAGLKAVGESCEIPLQYYDNNVGGTLCLLEVMARFGVKQMVFSSSATVYGEHNPSPLLETMPTSATNPYGQTKLVIEHILSDLAASDGDWSIINLRYFNPIGAHESGLIGEDPNGIPNNLLPFVAQVAVGRLPKLQVFGDDYPTIDGTGVRDYIHVVDLAKGHLRALDKLSDMPGCRAINLGTGNGTSVLEIVKRFSQVCGRDIPYEIAPRRPGDIATVYADANLARQSLGWQAERDLSAMIEDTWRWQSNNPNGYRADSAI